MAKALGIKDVRDFRNAVVLRYLLWTALHAGFDSLLFFSAKGFQKCNKMVIASSIKLTTVVLIPWHKPHHLELGPFLGGVVQVVQVCVWCAHEQHLYETTHMTRADDGLPLIDRFVHFSEDA